MPVSLRSILSSLLLGAIVTAVDDSEDKKALPKPGYDFVCCPPPSPRPAKEDAINISALL